MKISHKKPVLSFLLTWRFGFDWTRNIATFGDTIYTLHELPDHLVIHEKVHLAQHRYSKLYATWWWFKYFLSDRFRYEQELDAYREQYKFFIKNYAFRHYREFLIKIATDLSSPLYGSIVTFDQAKWAILEVSPDIQL